MATCGGSDNCRLSVDVVLQSSDGKQLGAHSKNLELYSDAFPTSGSTLPPAGDQDVVELSETAEVLQIVLQFTHNLPPPDLDSLALDALLGLAEAAHNRRIPEHPLEILAFKAKFSDLFMIDDAARRTMLMSARPVLTALDPDSFRKWVLYREEWQERIGSFTSSIAEWTKVKWPGVTALTPQPHWISPKEADIIEEERLHQNILKILEAVGMSSQSRGRTSDMLCTNFTTDTSNYHVYDFEKARLEMEELTRLVEELPQWKDIKL